MFDVAAVQQAADQVSLMRLFAHEKPHGVLGHRAREYGRHLMESIEPDERFGISCAPRGTTCDQPDFARPPRR
jgi:hypothetical protein